MEELTILTGSYTSTGELIEAMMAVQQAQQPTWLILIIQLVVFLLFLSINVSIYKWRFKKITEKDIPNNKKLITDIIIFTVWWGTLYYIFNLIFGNIWISAGFSELIIMILSLLWYFFILKFLSWKHTDKANTTKIAAQTVWISVLVWLLLFFAVWLILETISRM